MSDKYVEKKVKKKKKSYHIEAALSEEGDSLNEIYRHLL